MKIKHLEIHHFKGLESIEIKDCGSLNAFIGKNNSGKSSILHAIDLAGLALGMRNWNSFQPKIAVKDLFFNVRAFEMDITFDDNRTVNIKSNSEFAPVTTPEPDNHQKFKSILILPDTGTGLSRACYELSDMITLFHEPKTLSKRCQR
jgi:AAA15 family ATPase/GTPase